jgi:DNA polymerase III subunit delta
MPAHSFDALFRSLGKGDFAPVYYLYGAEDVLKEEAVRSIVDRALDPGLRDFNLDQRSVGQLDAEDIHALCYTLPMMADRRVVVLREVEAWRRKTRARSEFLRYLDRPSPDTVIVLVQGSGEESEDKELCRGAYVVRCDPLPPDRAAKWALREAGQLGIDLEPEAVDHLVRSVGADLAALKSELAKLSSLPAEAPLTPEQVGELVGVRRGETQWDWRSAVLEDQTGRAVTLLPAILAQPGMSGVKLVTALGTALLGVALTRSLYDKGARGRGLEESVVKALFRSRPSGLLSFRDEAAQWTRIVPDWPADRLRSALKAALGADQSLKSTTISDEGGVVTDLVLQIGMSRSGRRTSGRSGRSGSSASARGGGLLVRALSAFSALSALSALSAISALPAHAQTDPRLVEIVREAQEGEGDSARIKVQRLLTATSPGDTLYPQILYTQAMVADDAADMRRQLQRVAVEHSSSGWADDALLRLVQLDYASANLDGAARNLERIRQDYPGSPLLPQAAYWAARTYFDQKRPELACRWIAEGMAGASGNIELQNQLGYLNQRCAQFAAASPPRDTQPRPTPARDSAQVVGALPPDSGVPLNPSVEPERAPPPPSPAPPVPHPRAATPQPEPRRADTAVATKPADASTRYRVQITAVRSVATAREIAARVKIKGFNVVTVEEGGLYKVRVGDYPTKADAIAALPEIKAKLGGSPFVVSES